MSDSEGEGPADYADDDYDELPPDAEVEIDEETDEISGDPGDNDDNLSQADEDDEDGDELAEEEQDDEEDSRATDRAQMHSFIPSRLAPEMQEYEEHVIVPEDERRTSHIMSRAEFTELISISAERIAREGMRGCMLDEVPPGATTAREIAVAEILARRCPYKLMRTVGIETDSRGKVKKYVEIWQPNDMTFPG